VSLDLLAGSYNEIITCLHPVEEPLIKDRIEKMDVALTPALDLLKWKSNDIDKFILAAKEHVDSTFEVVQIMKEAISKIKVCLDNINVKVLERKNRTMTVEDYNTQHQAVFSQK
jgi:dynein heavy chain